MRISINWIKSLIPELRLDFEGENKSYDELFKRMVEIGLDIESIESERDKYNKFVVGEVLETEKHPNADKLTLCKVNVGDATLSIVCGAPNVTAGQKVCVARIGAIIPNGGFEIKKSKIRGELSEGMICAEDELGLSDNHSGIMVLNDNSVPGTEFADYTGANDYFVEIGVTPNRGDLFSQTGMAREIAGAYSLSIKCPEALIRESEEFSKDYIKIEIENKEFCKRFTGRVVKNVTIKESPEWLQKYLKAVGLRPINNIVDITNFVMMETGQPLHAFDYDKISGKKIIVKTAKEGDKFITLDSKERVLNEKSLMICDGEKPSAIAGIMGGEFSEISSDTKNVLIEVAYFDPVAIRKNSKKLGLQTDASQRFERGVDIENITYVSDRAASLMQSIAGGEVLKGIVDVYPERFEPLVVFLRASRVEKIVGINIPEDEIIRMLGGIEIQYFKKEEDKMYFKIPEFRREDIQREIDLVEETARLYGYANIKSDFRFNLDVSSHIDYRDKYQKFINYIREYFIGRGFNEIISYSQQDDKKISNFGTEPVIIENPNSILMNSMRVNLTFGMLTTIANNINALGKDVSLKLFELGKVFSTGNKKFTEEHHLCFSICGLNDKKSFDVKEKSFDLYDIKGELEIFLSKLNIENHELIYYNAEGNPDYFEVLINKSVAGRLMLLNKKTDRDFDMENDVYIAEFDTQKLYDSIKEGRKYKEISKYPSAKRDLALIIKRGTSYDKVKKVIIETGGSTIKSIDLFDIFSDKKLGDGNRSMTFSLELSAADRTLTDEEVNKLIGKIIRNLENKLEVTLRSN